MHAKTQYRVTGRDLVERVSMLLKLLNSLRGGFGGVDLGISCAEVC